MVGAPPAGRGTKTKENQPSMNIKSLKQQLLQSDFAETSAIFNEFLRGSARLALFDLIRQEFEELCGSLALPRDLNGESPCRQ
ncbi:MAG: hypothetical protein ACI8T1_003701 [Verrucomicrobiales bacterium]|jgi:hypothetical protein